MSSVIYYCGRSGSRGFSSAYFSSSGNSIRFWSFSSLIAGLVTITSFQCSHSENSEILIFLSIFSIDGLFSGPSYQHRRIKTERFFLVSGGIKGLSISYVRSLKIKFLDSSPNGTYPVSISQKMAPNEYISTSGFPKKVVFRLYFELLCEYDVFQISGALQLLSI